MSEKSTPQLILDKAIDLSVNLTGSEQFDLRNCRICAKCVPMRAEPSLLELCRVQPHLFKLRKLYHAQI
ncbi:hypothetical protein [uncultured Duncaniella sp.]|uniref:hypothetical protein n=1 Tax=uncultured Duncaniella sp. TaxID=2768039 RepID=UPI0025B65583|nr:hypothetical protein [uncultured Duncaniella sp.]